jgi:hypothetical protein
VCFSNAVYSKTGLPPFVKVNFHPEKTPAQPGWRKSPVLVMDSSRICGNVSPE